MKGKGFAKLEAGRIISTPMKWYKPLKEVY